MSSDAVSQVMFAALSGHNDPLMTRWTYRADDPFAVTIAIQTPGGRWVEWLVGRELLTKGLNGVAGDGDIRVSWQHVRGREVVRVTIRTLDGQAALTVDRVLARRFVDATAELVPVGSEAACIDFDAEIAKVTESFTG